MDIGESDPSPTCGGYYWVPLPENRAIGWQVVTCRDLTRQSGMSHARLWPDIVRQLSRSWGRAEEPLMRDLIDHYSGLPRGRVTRVRDVYLVHHGGDAPVPDWLARVESRFGLQAKPRRVLWDEHERMLAGDPEAVQRSLGVDLGLRGV